MGGLNKLWRGSKKIMKKGSKGIINTAKFISPLIKTAGNVLATTATYGGAGYSVMNMAKHIYNSGILGDIIKTTAKESAKVIGNTI